MIPHGTNPEQFALPRGEATEARIRLGYVGRLEHDQKSVLLLPKIARSLQTQGTPFSLQIIGAGPDEGRLRAKVKPMHEVQMLGAQPHQEIPGYLSQMDVLIVPSRHEGFGFSIVEAMAAGVVPVVSRIPRVTDWIVRDGIDGALCRIGDAKGFASAITSLARDRTKLQEMSVSARERVIGHFSTEAMGKGYDKMFSAMLATDPPACTPRPWSEFQPPPAPPGHWRRWVPRPARRWLCGAIQRFSVS